MTKLRRTASAIATCIVAVVALAACTAPVAKPASAPQASLVATTTQVADFVREITGGSAKVTQLLRPGQSAHSFDPSPRQLAALGQADALVINGAGLETWIKDAMDASGFHGKIIDASTGIVLDQTPGGAGEEHPGGNPHIWTDPKLAERMVQNIADGLDSVPGIDRTHIAKEAAAYHAQLQALDDWTTQSIGRVPPARRLLVTNHDAFTYFVKAYDLVFVGSVIPSFDDNAEPSAAQIDALVQKIKATGVKAVFSEASISPKAADAIAREAGVKVYSGPDSLYGDALGNDRSDGATYIASQIHNVRRIMESWGVAPAPLPGTLGG